VIVVVSQDFIGMGSALLQRSTPDLDPALRQPAAAIQRGVGRGTGSISPVLAVAEGLLGRPVCLGER